MVLSEVVGKDQKVGELNSTIEVGVTTEPMRPSLVRSNTRSPLGFQTSRDTRCVEFSAKTLGRPARSPDFILGGPTPKLHRAIAAPRDQRTPIRSKQDRFHRRRMSDEGFRLLDSREVP